METDEDIFKEIMALIDRRNRLCEEWIEKIDRELREGSISYDEYRRYMRKLPRPRRFSNIKKIASKSQE